jgi:hydrogenase maturation protease
MKKIGILGAGNLLLTDEGFGVHCVQKLQERYQIQENVSVLDGGTAGIMLAPFMESVDILYILDAVKSDALPGTILCFSQDELCSRSLNTGMSPHQLGLMEVLELCRLRGRAPEQVEVIAVVPEDVSTGIELSQAVIPCIEQVLNILRRNLQNHGVDLTERVPHFSA